MNLSIHIKLVPHNSKAYWEMVKLRDKILRQPLGLAFSKAELLNEHKQFHFGAYLEEQLVGCFVLVAMPEQRIKMRQVCIDNDFQNKGIGGQMLYFAHEWSVNNGYKTIYCHARDVAKHFYLKAGYHQIGDLFEEVGIPHYQLEKTL